MLACDKVIGMPAHGMHHLGAVRMDDDMIARPLRATSATIHLQYTVSFYEQISHPKCIIYKPVSAVDDT